jgi:hypothetical protein
MEDDDATPPVTHEQEARNKRLADAEHALAALLQAAGVKAAAASVAAAAAAKAKREAEEAEAAAAGAAGA